MPSFPTINPATTRRGYLFGDYRTLLMDSVRSAQAIQYDFILVVIDGDDEMPLFGGGV